MILLGYISTNHMIPSSFKPATTYYSPAIAAKSTRLPCFGGVGTGGFDRMDSVTSHHGYRFYVIIKNTESTADAVYAPYMELMQDVKNGFGRTMSHLPFIFGVSRQTLYNWLAGETPKKQHQDKLIQLAAAARFFIETGFKPTSIMLDRTISQGKSFLELLNEAADGTETAQKLIHIVKRNASSREALDTLLRDRTPPRLTSSDMGRPSLKKDGE